ncbi:internalin, putative [Candidatus Syntrophocurvum alkaliphilum]|uniref:Internalin, putative n=2 Tax=Candidatus Syntrophocurvum alkaliphilum TaxID=2293317 RepID=A0A6I6D594_9FIRM|nr:internalin, putative [Candidatus Syntrophocurvum alkaliphilum]
MAFDPNLFLVSINPKPLNIVLGKDNTLTVTASNQNPADWGYNLTFELTIPDGVSFSNADEPPTRQVLNLDSTITLIWESIKDLAPNEIGYTFSISLQSDETFRDTGIDVPFDIPLSALDFKATVDTLPRGNAEPGNIQYTKTDTTDVIPLRYNISKIVPGKEPKGAGIPPIPPDAQWPFDHTIIIDNNTRESTIVGISDVLDNGIRYIGPINAIGPDAVQLLTPLIVVPIPGGQDFVTIDWINITLSTGSINTISYEVGIWNNFTINGEENTGNRIPHQTPMEDTVTMDNGSGPVSDTDDTLAMDLTISKSQNITTIDTGIMITYSLTYRVNQYDDINDVVITDILSDGQTYQVGSASIPPTSVSPKNPLTGETTVVWDIGNLNSSDSATITFHTLIDDSYFVTGLPVLSGDDLYNDVYIDGINATTGTPTPDSSTSSGSTPIPSISKTVENFYYNDGTPKPPTINAVAPGDFIEFKITYNAPFNAEQQDPTIDDFFPFTLDATSITNIVYNPFVPAQGPNPIGTNGVRWILGSFIPGGTTWDVTFWILVDNIDFTGFLNNLVKLSTINTTGLSVSDRDQVPINFGETDMFLEKDIAGPTPNAIQAGQTYTYTVVIRNQNNPEGTVVDAFDVDFSDIIPNFLTYTVGTLSATATAGTPDFNPPIFTAPDQINMTINHLKPDDEITVTYDVTVDAGIGPNIEITNEARTTKPFSQPGGTYQFPNQDRLSETTLSTASTSIDKSVDINNRIIDDTVNYTITWTVPVGTIAYDVVISDTLPTGQSYDNDPSPVPPESVIGQVITWPVIPIVDATNAAQTLIYSFRAKINSAVSNPPSYIDIQTNTGRVNWNAAPGSLPREITDTANVNVLNPNILIVKAERNVSQGQTSFVTSTNAMGGEIIEYRLTVTNNGSANAFNIQIIDQLGGLDLGTVFKPLSIIAPPGTTANYNITSNLVEWNIPFLAVGNSLQLFFRVRVKTNLTPGTVLTNTGTVTSYTNENLEFIYPSTNSNIVQIIILPGVRGINFSDLSNAKVIRIT